MNSIQLLVKFSFVNGFGRDCITFGVDMTNSIHVDNKKKDILIIDEGGGGGVHRD